MRRFWAILCASWALALVIGVLFGLSTPVVADDNPPHIVVVEKKIDRTGGSDDIVLPPNPCNGCVEHFISSPPGGSSEECWLYTCLLDACVYTCTVIN